MNKSLPWLRLYHRIIDDEKLRLLAFEDRWHFIAVLCLKAEGLLDEPESDLKWRRVAVKMGVQARELDEIKRRLSEVNLVDENMHPLAWDGLQYVSDTSTERVRKHRAKSKTCKTKRSRNVSVTPPDTDTESDTDISSLRSDTREKRSRSPRQVLAEVVPDKVAKDLVDHRIRIRKPMTERAAELLAGKLSRFKSPEAAANMIIEKGWQSIDPDWQHGLPLSRDAPAPDDDAKWIERLEYFKREREWPHGWGPPPGPGCKVPQHLIERMEIEAA